VRRVVFALLSIVAVCAAEAQQPARPLILQVRALVDSGKLEEAERVARAGGAPLTEALGEVLVLRGRRVEAVPVLNAALKGDASARRAAQATLAELAYGRGARDEAVRLAGLLVSEFAEGGTLTADDFVSLGRANVLRGTRDAEPVRYALQAFDKAVALAPSNVEARLRAGDLLLDKYNAPDAKLSYQDVLKVAPENARALLGLARVAVFEGKGDAPALLQRSLAANPNLADAHVLAARFHLETEQYDSAMTDVRRALAADSSSLGAWSMLGAAARMTGDSAQYNRALAAAQRLNSKPSDFYAELADAFVRQRRYDEAMGFARVALAVDSTSPRVLGMLGDNELHAGHMQEGRALLERAFAIDPFNLWHKNTLDLLDKLKSYRTIDRGHFRFVAPPKEAELLTTYLSPLLEQAYDSLSMHYGYKPAGLIRLEIYPRHADFAVRAIGLSGLGALGVSFGPVLMMDAPSARPVGEFNWGSVAWHELAHTFTLGLSNNRAPRWLSEGLSVLEERRARPSWGGGATLEFLAAYSGGRLRPVSQLNDGFVRPRFDNEVILSYYEASLVCEMIAETKGAKALIDMLTAYREGLSTPAVFSRVLGSTPEQFDKQFDTWLKAKLAGPLTAVTAGDGKSEPSGPFVSAMRAGVALMEQGNKDSARVVLQHAEALFPDYSGNGAPAVFLAQLARDGGDPKEALAQVQRVTSRSETAVDANLLEADLREILGDSVGARAPLERLIWMTPYDIPLHVRLAKLAERTGDHVAELRERRAIVALDPPDPLDAHYELARALANSGDVAGARRELLGVLEQAPAFEKAQTLLLELKSRTAAPVSP
jgi:tetratricopeptide (TPR) repeat protein